MNIISRAEAKTQGLQRYFTGKPCKHGHISERLVSTRICCECSKIAGREYRDANPDKIREKSSRYYAKNTERVLERNRLYRANAENRTPRDAAYKRLHAAKRRAAKLQATPAWADLQIIEAFYKEAERLTRETGILHQVDHIVPLQNKLVCGYHNHFNLQILTKLDNILKGNRQWPDMPGSP